MIEVLEGVVGVVGAEIVAETVVILGDRQEGVRGRGAEQGNGHEADVRPSNVWLRDIVTSRAAAIR